MKGIIGIQNHKIQCIIGLYEAERLQQRDIFVDVKVEVDFSPSEKFESLENTIDYVKIIEDCDAIALKGEYYLIEKFAMDVLDHLLKNYPIKWASILVKKPLPALGTDFVLVCLEQFAPLDKK